MKAFRRPTEVSGVPVAPNSEVGRWIAWALGQAERLDPLVPSPPSILEEKVAPYFF
jgi:hypothetical protein